MWWCRWRTWCGWCRRWLGSPAQWQTRYDLPMQAALVVGLLMAEWLLRRRWQMS